MKFEETEIFISENFNHKKHEIFYIESLIRVEVSNVSSMSILSGPLLFTGPLWAQYRDNFYKKFI